MKIIQVTGYKKSGKTTVINSLIKAAVNLGLTVSVIKHHGEIAGEEIDIPKKRDHLTFMDSGAAESIVEGYQYIHKLTRPCHRTLQEIIDEEVTAAPDVLLIEGYKQAEFPKIILLRDDDDKGLLELSNIKHVFYRAEIDELNYQQLIMEGL